MSKYGDLARVLRTAIADGTYPQGSRLPTIPALCDLYEVSNTTVKCALDELEADGLVARRRGSGIYVKRSAGAGVRATSGTSVAGQMSGLSAEFAALGKVVESDVKEFSVIHPSEQVAAALGISCESFVYNIRRVRIVDGIPRNVEHTLMPLDVIPGLVERHLHGSIYHYIESDLHLRIDSAHRVVRAVAPTADERSWLHLKDGEPLLEIRQVGYLDDGTPFECSRTRHTSDYEFRVISSRS